MPDAVVDANFYRSASRVSDDVAPVEVIQLNPAVSPASALREACLCWPDLITNPPNWRVVGVHVAKVSISQQRPTSPHLHGPEEGSGYCSCVAATWFDRDSWTGATDHQ